MRVLQRVLQTALLDRVQGFGLQASGFKVSMLALGVSACRASWLWGSGLQYRALRVLGLIGCGCMLPVFCGASGFFFGGGGCFRDFRV